jgi:hypothetical protein
MAAMTPIGTIAMTETAVALIVMMIAAEAMAHGMMTAGEVVIMAPGEMTVEDTSTGTMTATALATNATTTMMMMTVMADQLLPETAIEVMWIIGIGIDMKDHGVLLARQKVRANMGGIDQET